MKVVSMPAAVNAATHPSLAPILWGGLLLVVASQASGCRSKLDVKTTGNAISAPASATLPPDAVDEPIAAVEKPAALQLAGQKLYFQSRDTVTIRITRDVIEGAATFSLLNVTNGDDDTATAIIKDEPVPADFKGSSLNFALYPVADDAVVVELYPGNKDWQDKFSYGKNRLKVVANDAANPRYAYTELYLEDFELFSPSVMTFSENLQVASLDDGSQFQGWLNLVSIPSVAADDGTVLTTGFFDMVNRQ